MHILGISAFYHDSAACLIEDGEIIAAAQEERFTRKKNDASFPKYSIQFCVKQSGIDPAEIRSVVFYEKPILKFERILETYFSFAPKGFSSFAKSMPIWAKEKFFQKTLLANELAGTLGSYIDWRSKLLFSSHHLSHGASAFFPSPYDDAAILTLDGVGEWATTSLAMGNKNRITTLKEIHFPHSLGLLYSAFTYYTGFKVNSGEYKLMGLAPYGRPKYKALIEENLINVAGDGSFHINMEYFDFATGLKMTNRKFERLFGGPARPYDFPPTQREMDIAASVQTVIEDVILKLAQDARSTTGSKNLCLAGGVALNCVANGRILREKIFDNVWVQPAAGDAGGALGAALAVWHMHFKGERSSDNKSDRMQGSLLGPAFSDLEIEEELRALGARYERLNDAALFDRVASALAEGKVVGWHQGRMEFGPRALGNRSILADPRDPDMQSQLNMKIKYRESFRPFAPSVLEEDAGEWFDTVRDSPYMGLVDTVAENKRCRVADEPGQRVKDLTEIGSEIPAVTHVDFTSRLQTVSADHNPRFHALISAFKSKTEVGLIVNTSFNVRGEPIVCTPKEAFNCFMSTDMDLLAINNFLVMKQNRTA